MVSALIKPVSRPTQKRCGRCRALKSSCDKTRPACRNCVNRGLTCPGYAFTLSWPRANDHRRSAQAGTHYLIPINAYGQGFSNISARDVQLATSSPEAYIDSRVSNVCWQPTMVSMNLQRLDPFMSTRGHSPIAHLVAPTGNDEALYGLLVRLALNDERPASVAARHAISALSYRYLNMRAEAVSHQSCALRALQKAIESQLDRTQTLQAMAASMLLNIYETMHFDSSDLSWSIFFCGTKRIARTVFNPHDTFIGEQALLVDWIFYHDIMYKFSIRHWAFKNRDQIALAADNKIISKALFSPERQTIVPALGCSLELLDIVCEVIDAVLERDDPRHLSTQHLSTLRRLELRLQLITQNYAGNDERSQEGKTTAELYRIAALIYLHRLAKVEKRDSNSIQDLIKQGFSILESIGCCERPWPLFIIAIEARGEEERTTVLKVLGESLGSLALGNMVLTSRMIQSAWLRRDLGDNSNDLLDLYGNIISSFRVPPSFT